MSRANGRSKGFFNGAEAYIYDFKDTRYPSWCVGQFSGYLSQSNDEFIGANGCFRRLYNGAQNQVLGRSQR